VFGLVEAERLVDVEIEGVAGFGCGTCKSN